MTLAQAVELNRAACAVYLFRAGILGRVSVGDVRLVARCTGAQLQTASEILEADNAQPAGPNGCKYWHTLLAPDAAGECVAFARRAELDFPKASDFPPADA